MGQVGSPMPRDQHVQPLWWHLPKRCSDRNRSSEQLILWYRSPGGFKRAKEDDTSMQRLQIPGMARL